MASEDVRYRQSTQYRLWSFSPVQLQTTREQTNSLARANISERLLSSSTTSSSNLKPPPASSTSNPSSGANTPNADPQAQAQQQQQQQQQQPPDFLTPADELQLLNYYTVELLRAANHFNLRSDMRASAAVFLRRFYVTNSIMTYPPTEMLKTCLFFGCKAEGHYPSAKQFAAQFPKTEEEGILAGEYILCQGVRFAFDVKHPFRALEGAVSELRRYGDVDATRIDAAYERARAILKFSALMTDAYFHYTPSQIMLASLSLADEDLATRIIHETFHPQRPSPGKNSNKGSGSGGAGSGASSMTPSERARILGSEMRDKVTGVVNACRDMLAREPPERMGSYWDTPESSNIIKPLLKKLRKCRDPDRFNLVELQRVRKEEALRREKAAEMRESGGGKTVQRDGTVFGEGLGMAQGGGAGRDVKRRKVDDPFGGPLGG